MMLLVPSGVFASDFFTPGWNLPELSSGSVFNGSDEFPDPGLDIDPVEASSAKDAAGMRVEPQSAFVNGHISVWAQDCAADPCSFPQSLAPSRAVNFELNLPASPGQARTKTVFENFVINGIGRLKVKLAFYSVCPYGSVEGCPARYFQVQAELSGATSAFCAASLNAGDFLPFPVIMCAGRYQPEKKLGITLHRRPL